MSLSRNISYKFDAFVNCFDVLVIVRYLKVCKCCVKGDVDGLVISSTFASTGMELKVVFSVCFFFIYSHCY